MYRVWTGWSELDGRLHGHQGLMPGEWVEIVGEMATGRTTLLLQTVARCLVYDPTAQVCFIDCQVSLSHRRLLQLIDRFQGEQLGAGDRSSILNRLHCYQPACFEELTRVLMRLWCFPLQNLRLLVIDSIGTPLRSHSLTDFTQWQSAIRQTGLCLRRLAHRQALTIMTTNHLNGSGGPLLGDTWAQFIDRRVILRWRSGQRLYATTNNLQDAEAYEISPQGIL